MESKKLPSMMIPELAEITGCSKGLLYNLAKQDKLPVKVIRLGRRIVLSRAAVEALFSANGHAGNTPS
jgi:predicted DNA-binding transcriptional regulator AlpA